MHSKHSCFAQVAVFWLCLGGVSAVAQDNVELPQWSADQGQLARLGEVFADSRISIRPPRHLQRADRPNSPEMTKIGVFNYGWTPGGVFPSLENLSVGLTPYAQPSSAALDKTVEGMKKSIEKGLEEVQFGETRKGRMGSREVRAGEYKAQISDQKIVAFFLVGIDEKGTFAVTAMLPASQENPDKIQALKASMLTFRRVE